jgi:Ca2+-binding RTX toxin-like protein
MWLSEHCYELIGKGLANLLGGEILYRRRLIMARIEGNNLGEVITGTSFSDTIFGNDGNDIINGLEAADFIFGGNDDDALFGDEGRDRLSGDLGLDELTGGAGRDFFIFISGDTAADRVTDYQDESDLLNVRAWDVTFEELTFTETASGNLIVRGNNRGERFVLENTTEAQIDRGDFIF